MTKLNFNMTRLTSNVSRLARSMNWLLGNPIRGKMTRLMYIMTKLTYCVATLMGYINTLADNMTRCKMIQLKCSVIIFDINKNSTGLLCNLMTYSFGVTWKDDFV